MRKTLLTLTLLTLTLTLLFFPLPTHAGVIDTLIPETGDLAEKIKTGDIGFGDIVKIIGAIIRFVTVIAAAVAVIFVIIGGFQYLISGYSADNKEMGKQTIRYALIGLVITLLAWFIVDTVMNVVTA